VTSGQNGDSTSSLLGHYNATYMGGHTEYPTARLTGVFIYPDNIFLQGLGLQIPYSCILKIYNANKEEISGFLFIGPVGTWWKKNHLYTVIQYKNGIDNQTIVVDFDRNIDSVQPLIYRRMIRFKQMLKENRPREGFLVYENTLHRIRIEYPSNWIEDETNEENGDFITVTEFRTTIENKSPFVTLFINKLPKDDISLREFVDKEMDELRKDSRNFSTTEFTSTVLGETPAHKLVYSEDRSINDKRDSVYTEMIIWTKIGDKVYEIRYSAKKPDYMRYLPLVDHMINSFKMVRKAEEPTSETEAEQKASDTEEPLVILKRRFARGEISEEEYERMRRIIEK
jgi:hypothetical protein